MDAFDIELSGRLYRGDIAREVVVVLGSGNGRQTEGGTESKSAGSHDAASVAQLGLEGRNFVVFCGVSSARRASSWLRGLPE